MSEHRWRPRGPTVVAGLLLAICWLPLYLFWQPLPSPGTPNDVVWMAEYTHALATGQETIFGIQDPYLRYVVQATILSAVDFVGTVTVRTAMLVNAHLVILLEGLVTPLALYWFARKHHDRWSSVGVLGALALVQFHVASWTPRLPEWLFDSPHWGTGYWTTYTPELLGKTWYLTTYWHYALAPAVVIVTFGLVSRVDRTTPLPRALQVGLVVGIVGGIQVIQAALTAAVVAAVLLSRRATRQLLAVGAVAAIVAAPTAVVGLVYSDAWSRMSTRRIVLETPNLLAAATMLAVLVGIFGLCYYVFTHRIALPYPLSAVPAVGYAWPALSLVAVLVAVPLSAGWYRMVAASILKYGVAYLLGVTAVTVVRIGWAIVADSRDRPRYS